MQSLKLSPKAGRISAFLERFIDCENPSPRRRKEMENDLSVTFFPYKHFINVKRIDFSSYNKGFSTFDFCVTDGKKVTGYMINATFYNVNNLY